MRDCDNLNQLKQSSDFQRIDPVHRQYSLQSHPYNRNKAKSKGTGLSIFGLETGMKRDIFGRLIFIKKNCIRLFGIASYPRFNWKNTTDIQGSVRLTELPNQNVLFVSNHQTYFADVALMAHAINSAHHGRIDNVRYPGFFRPRLNLYFVAADETVQSGLLPRIMAYCGAVSVKRTWRKDGEDIQRKVDPKDQDNIAKALADGWVISFPQGTTKPFVPGRKGTAHMIKEYRPIVIPVVINGFRRAFDKKGLFIKKKGTTLSMWFKPVLDIDYDAPIEDILAQVMDGIEQSEAYNQVPEPATGGK